jgi:N-acetylmuramoyl-L-alanine amidase
MNSVPSKLPTILLFGTSLILLTYILTHSSELPSYIKQAEVGGASIFSSQEVTNVSIQSKYNNALTSGKKVKILIVAGHEPDQGGAEYKTLKEREMTVSLALDLGAYFKKDPHYDVTLTRDEQGWNPVLETYFTAHQKDIASFVQEKKAQMDQLVAQGKVTKVTGGIEHLAAPNDVALRLYGINKWATENGIDMMIHVHFNEYPRRAKTKPGKYTGFVIYVPDAQYSNAQTSSSIANHVLSSLGKLFPISNLPKEDDGIVEEQDLIALGAANTASMPSILVEYGYLYDPIFGTATKRTSTFDSMAKQTYLGVQDYFSAPTQN